MDAVVEIVGGGGARHHVERGFGHVGMGMARGFEAAVELAFHGGDVDDVLVALGSAKHEGFQARVQDERSDRIDKLNF
jgi:hypothetical protein